MPAKVELHIGNRVIGYAHRPFVIAEMSGNHNQSLERALKIVEAAARAGAHAIKLQTYTADTMTLPGAYRITDPHSLWTGQDLYELYQQAYTPWEWHEAIMKKAHECGILCFSTPFDESAVDFLEKLNVPAYKIASFENTDFPLLKKVAQTGKPVIMSTGVATLSMIDESFHYLKAHGSPSPILLKCTSTYPASPENTNLKTIPHLQEAFDTIVGLSDHTLGIGVSVAAVALGARVIEKHFTLSRADGGVDAAFSLEPHELKQLVEETERAFLALGKIQYGMEKNEQKSSIFKRSIYVVKNIKKGEIFTKDNIRVIRPSLGLEPRYYEKIIGKTACRDLPQGHPLSWDDLIP